MFYINFIFPLICISQIRGKIFLVISFHQILNGAGEGAGKGSERRSRRPVDVLNALLIELYVADVHARETGQLGLGISGGKPHAAQVLLDFHRFKLLHEVLEKPQAQ